MPFYEYECSSCKYAAEVLQKISDAPLRKCPSCGKATFKRLVSAPVFRLKGSGWYETDFKSDKERKRNLAAEREEAKPAAESASAAPAGGTESKPAAKAEPAPASRPRPAVTRRAPAKRAAARPRAARPRRGRGSR